jgi:hypothetical protein
MNGKRPFGRAVAANVALLVLLVGVPLALLAAIGSPLPQSLPTWSQLSTALTRGDVSDRTLLKVIAGCIWLAWLQIAGTVLNEIIATVRGVTSRPLPFSPMSVQLGAGRLVATAALLFASLHQPPARPTASLPRPLLAAQVAEVVPTTDGTSASVETPPSTITREWVVAPRETLWGIAERVLGDGRAYTQLLALNHGRPQPDGTAFTDPHHLQPGTRLLLPPTGDAPATSAVHHVVPGDSLSTIAGDELHDSGRWPEVFELNCGNPQPDGGRLIDPDLLRPGWTLHLPEASGASPATEPAVEPSVDPTPPPPPTPATSSDGTSREDRRPVDAEPPEAGESGPSLAEQIEWTGGAVLSGGVLLLAGRLRRRRRTTLRALRRPSRRISDIDLALRAESTSDDHLSGATRTLRQLALDLRHHSLDTTVPQVIELGTAYLEVLWTRPLLPTAGYWTSTDGGWSWTHSTTDPPLTTEGAAPCPTLVTIGSRDNHPVLANLEALGVLAVRGDDAPDLLRALVLELATTPFADVLTVITCGLPEPHPQLDRVSAMSLTDALSWARNHTGADGTRRPRTSFAERIAARTEPREPLVVVCGDVDVNDPAYLELLDVSRPGSGVVVLLLEPPERADEWCLRGQGATVTLEPLGLVLTAHPVTPQGAEAVVELLDNIGDGDDAEDDQPGDIVPASIGAAWNVPVEVPETGPGEGRESEGDGFTEAPCDVELRLFGQVDVGGTTTKLTPGEIELLVYLHCHPEGQTADLIRTALWPDGRSPKTLHNRMSGLRNKLGLGADGQLLLPHGTDDRYRLSPRVTSDWRRALSRIQHADTVPSNEAVATLRDALELVTGPPFVATTGYSWAYSEGLATEMIEVIKHAARHLAELSFDAGDPTGAIWAVRRGQRVTSPADSQQLTLIAMKAHAELGNPAAAVAAYRELLADLDELDPDLEPAPDVSATYDAIRRARAS